MNSRPIHESQVHIPLPSTSLQGTLSMPKHCRGLVVFAHGSGSSRFSPRNIAVSQTLLDQACATFLFDLLDLAEAQDRRNVFDIQLLAERMMAATDRMLQLDEVNSMPLGYFGASTGAAAAIVAAAQRGSEIAAIVSRGGRPDLAGASLAHVTSPTLLLVGSLDAEVLQLNRSAQEHMHCESRLSIIEGATHLFEEPGTLKQAARQAGEWFINHFARAN